MKQYLFIKITFVIILNIFLISDLYSQNKTIELSGNVKNVNGEILAGANIYIKNTKFGISSNEQGKYSLSVPSGRYEIYCSFIGCQTDSMLVNLIKDTLINFTLEIESIINKEVVISTEKLDDNLSEKIIGTVKVDRKSIEKMPSLMGESDPFRYLQLSAGVQSVGEGFSSFYVRGGNYDQNLILFNNATIFNPSHLLGFFSVFNNDIVEEATLYKGLIPSKYGGRTSSVLDIRTKYGDMQKMQGEVSIGILASKIFMNVPVIKNKLSFQLAYRKTYINQVLNPIIKKINTDTDNFFDNSYGFYDLNGIISGRLNHNNFVQLSYYLGKDDFSLNKTNAINIGMNWGNAAFSAIWKHIFTETCYHELSVSNSNYNFLLEADQDLYFLQINSKIQESKINYILNKKVKDNKIYTGFETSYNKVLPGDKTIGFNDSEFTFNDGNYINAVNFALFAGDNFRLFPNVDVDFGLRLNYYAFIGPYTYYIADDMNFLTDSLTFSEKEIIKSDLSLTPRLSVNYRINETTSIKAGISYSQQNLHLAEIGSVTLPADFWLPSTMNIIPQKGKIFSAGIFKNFSKHKIQTNVEAYYKITNNIIEYNSGFISNYYEYNIDDNIIMGKGKAWGIETELKYIDEKFQSHLSYTYSRSLRYFNQIFNGKAFYAKHDRPHDLSLALFYNFTKRLSVSAVFVFASGKLMTVPYSRYLIQGMVVNSYVEKNSYRMPDYHRLDLSIVYKNKPERKWQSSWEFSVYNVYNRMNPFFIYYEITGNTNDYEQEIKAKQVTMFPILPSISWKLKF